MFLVLKWLILYNTIHIHIYVYTKSKFLENISYGLSCFVCAKIIR